ncbi:MAG: thioredoxin family protein [Planctomycetota bacterium]
MLDLARGDSPKAEWVQLLAGLDRAVELLVFVASGCPHCAQAVRTANALSLANPLITTHIVDAQRLPEMAARFNVQSVPVTLIDSGLGFTGAVAARELVERILEVGTPEHENRVFVSLVQAARFEDAAARVRDAGGAHQFAAAWLKSAMSLRMGLLLLAGRVLAGDRHALDSVVPSLLPALSAADAALRGDTADLLGQIGHPSAVPALAARIDDKDPDVAEVAREALEQIRDPEG